MMQFASFLLAVATCAQAIVVPRTIVTPYQNVTYANPPAPTTIAAASCPINCSYTIQSATVYTWLKLPISSTITHAVQYVIVNNRTNTTRTSISYMELPAGVTLPPTNSAGTHITQRTVSSPVPGGSWSTFVTNITYPHVFTQYPSGYTWWGAAATTTTGGASVCAWEPFYWSGSEFSYKTEVDTLTRTFTRCVGPSPDVCTTVPPYTSSSTLTLAKWSALATGREILFTSVQEFGTATPTADPEDPNGYLYIIADFNGPQYGKGVAATPSPPGNQDAIWDQCTFGETPLPSMWTSSGVEPVGDLSSAYFVTVTSTLHEDSGPTTTSSLGEGLGSFLAPTASSGASATADLPTQTSDPASPTDQTSKKDNDATSSLSIFSTATVDGVGLSPPSNTPAETTADVSFSFPGESASSSFIDGSDTIGIDMGFTKSTDSQPETIGIDLNPSTPESAVSGTPAAGTASVTGEGFNIGFGPHTGGPTLVLTEIGGSFVLSTVGVTSAPAGTASAESDSPTSTTAPSEPDSPEHTSAASEPDSPAQTSAASEPDSPEQISNPGLPALTTASSQESGSTTPAASPTPIEVGGITVSRNSDTQLVVGSQTLAAGSSIVLGTGSSTTAVFLQTEGSSTNIVVGTATAAVPSPAPVEPAASSNNAPAPFEVGGITASQNSASEIVIGTQTLAVGSSIVVGSGSSTTAVALQTEGGTTQIVVGGSATAAVPTAAAAAPASPSPSPSPSPFEVGGVTASQNSASEIVIGTRTLAPGSSIVLGSGSSTTAVVLQTSDGSTRLVVGSSTAAIPAAAAAAAPATSADGAAAPVVFGNETLTPGSTLTLGSGTRTTALVLSTNAAGDAAAIVVADASTTYTIAAPTASAFPPTTTTVPTTGAHLLTAGATTELVVGTQTYTFKTGGPSIGLVTVSGTTIVVAGSGSAATSIPIPTSGTESSGASSTTTTTTTRRASASGDGLASGSGGGNGVGWASGTGTGTGAGASASSTGAAAAAVGGSGGGILGMVCAVLGWLVL